MATDWDNTKTLAQLVIEEPGAMPVLEQLGLDYCCRGGRTIAEACAERGLEPGSVRAMIDGALTDGGAQGGNAWTTLGMSELADHIEQTHHARARELFQRLSQVVPRVVAAHSAEHPELVEVAQVLSGLSDEMHDHMVREERVLFPWLRRLFSHGSLHKGPPWSVRRPIDCMVHDHDSVSAGLSSLKRLLSGFVAPPDACGSYVSMVDMVRDLTLDTHLHIHKENNVLFPAGIRAEAGAEMAARERCGSAVPSGSGACELGTHTA